MSQQLRRRFVLPAVVMVAAGAIAALVATASGGSARAIGHMSPASIPMVKVGALASFRADPTQPTCDTSIGTFNCYAPSDIQSVYDYPTGKHAPDGSGQTIVIVDAYGTDYESATGSSLNDDLAAFDATFGVPAPPGGGVTTVAGPPSTCVEVGTDCSGDPGGWAGEISLDVEYAHAMAPGARIVLASASSDSDADINAAEAAILPHYRGAIVSQSFGGDEAGDYADFDSETAMHAIFKSAVAQGDTLIASAGDWGATNGDPYIMASYPASDPFVLAVGGTEGSPYPDGLWKKGRYGGEEVWNEPQFGDLATGGAPSVVWNAPPWQAGLTRSLSGRQDPSHGGNDGGNGGNHGGNDGGNGGGHQQAMRLVPDVAYDAAVEGGVLTVESDGGTPYIYIVGGTSAGSPQWAGILALADQVRSQHHQSGLGVAAKALYEIASDSRSYRSDFHDITSGNNAPGSGNAPLHQGDLGFAASRGYDLATGLGTPDVANLINDLASRDRGDGWSGEGGPGKGQHGGRGGRGRFRP